MRFYMSDYNFSAIARFQTHTEAVYLKRWHGWCHMKPLPSRAFCVHHTTADALCHFLQSHIRKVRAYLAVTCHLHFWQNDHDLLRAPAVIRGWNGYQNKSQHINLTLEKKILPPLLNAGQCQRVSCSVLPPRSSVMCGQCDVRLNAMPCDATSSVVVIIMICSFACYLSPNSVEHIDH